MESVQPRNSQDAQPVAIRVEGLWKSFGEQAVLQGVDLTVRQGELVAIVGGSGCGKTVLLHCIIAHLRPDRGRVLMADFDHATAPLRDVHEIDEDALDALRVHWAVVFQRNALFSGTVFENISLWPKEIKGQTDEEIRPRAEAAVRAVGLDPAVVLDRARDDLSGGMAKRVAVARALVMDPAILFFDEPTAGLDPEHSALLHGLIASTHDSRTSSGMRRTTLVITHDTALLRRIRPRIVMLHHGVVSFDGPYEEFERSQSPVIRPYFEMMPVLNSLARRGTAGEHGEVSSR